MLTIIIWLLVVFIVLPAALVAIGLPFAVEKPSKQVFKVYQEPEAIKRSIDLPDWLKWLQNPEDGLTGDARGWYWNTYWPKGTPAWFKMWYWSGVRNTWNYFKRVVIGIDIRNYNFELIAGQPYVRDDLVNPGFQVIRGQPKKGIFPIYMLYWVRPWDNTGRGICLQIGYKIKLDHNFAEYDKEIDYFKGITFEPNPYKYIR